MKSIVAISHRLHSLGAEARATLLLLLAVSCIVLPHFEHLPVWASVIAFGAFAAKVWLISTGKIRPHRWWLALIAAVIGAATLREFGTLLGRDAGVTLLVMLICVKLLEMRARRDVFVVIFLGFFVALCQFLYSQAIPTATLVGLGTFALFTALTAEHLGGDAGDKGAPGIAVALRYTARAVAFAVPITVALFVLFPRLPGPLWGSPGDGSTARTGLSNTMSPGAIAKLAESDAIAFRVAFEGQPPPVSAVYFRAIVFGAFDGRTWRENTSPLKTPPPPSIVEPLGSQVRYALTMEPHGKPWLFTLEAATAPPRVTGSTRPMQARPAPDGAWVADREVRERVVVQGAAATRYRLVPRETRLSLQEWLELPPGFNPRTLELAQQLQRTTDDHEALVKTVLTMFREQPFRYTLSPPLIEGNTVDQFLFETRAGFCEHYAAAFVVLMRALDIPARVVTGYQGGEFNPVDGVLEVRQSDAHAWTEVWLGDRGWVRIDPTGAVAPWRVERGVDRTLAAPSGIGGLIGLAHDNLFARAFRKARYRWDAIENSWNQWVLGYNNEAQRDLFSRLGLPDANWRDLMFSALASVAVLSLGMTARLLMKPASRDPWLRRFHALEVKLAKRGLEREAHEGPAQWRSRIAGTLDAQEAVKVLQALDALIAMRYGAATNDPPTLRTVARWIASLELPPSRSA